MSEESERSRARAAQARLLSIHEIDAATIARLKEAAAFYDFQAEQQEKAERSAKLSEA